MNLEKDKKNIKNFLINTVHEISDEKYQERIWIKGEGPEISSVGELFCNFFDDLGIEEIFRNYEKYQISKFQLKLLRELYNRMDEYDKFLPIKPVSEEVIKDPNWHAIRSFAKKVYKELIKEK